MARGPGSVAYGSDAFGGVISRATTRKVRPARRCGARVGHARRRRARAPRRRDLSRGFARGRRARRRPRARRRRLRRPGGRGLQLRLRRSGVLARVDAGGRRGLPLGRLAERLRPRHRAAAQQLAHGALLLSDRGLAPVHRGLRPARGRPASRAWPHALRRPYAQVTDQDRFATATTAAQRRARRRPRTDFQVRGFGRAAARPGAGGSSASTSTAATGCARSTSSSSTTCRRAGSDSTENVSVDSARRVDTRRLCQRRRGAGRRGCRWPAACAATTSRRRTTAASSATVDVPTAPASGFVALTAASVQRPHPHGAGGARLPRSDAVGPLLPRSVGPRLHHRQPRPRAGDEPAVRRRRALHRRARVRAGGLRLPLPHRRPDRALPDADRLLLLPQPRPRADARLRGRDADRSAVAADRSSAASRSARGRALDRRRLPRRHHHRDRIAAGAEADRRARLRSGAGGVVRRGRSPRPDRARRPRLHPGGRRRRRDDRQDLELRGWSAICSTTSTSPARTYARCWRRVGRHRSRRWSGSSSPRFSLFLATFPRRRGHRARDPPRSPWRRRGATEGRSRRGDRAPARTAATRVLR